MEPNSFIKSVHAVETSCFDLPLTFEMIEDQTHNKDIHFLFMEKSGQLLREYPDSNPDICAYCSFLEIPSEQILELIRIAVMSECRRKGFAQKLIQAMTDFAVEKQAARILLEVSEQNAAALALYRKSGFRNYHIRKSYYRDGSNAVLYEKIIH